MTGVQTFVLPIFGGQAVSAGSIIVRQRGTRVHAAEKDRKASGRDRVEISVVAVSSIKKPTNGNGLRKIQ